MSRCQGQFNSGNPPLLDPTHSNQKSHLEYEDQFNSKNPPLLDPNHSHHFNWSDLPHD